MATPVIRPTNKLHSNAVTATSF